MNRDWGLNAEAQRTRRDAEVGKRKIIKFSSALLRVLCVSAFVPPAFMP